MTWPVVGAVDDRLTLLAMEHFRPDQPLPPILDVTGASASSVPALQALPVITFERVDDDDPPPRSPLADIAVPAASAASLVTAVHRNPTAALVVTQLVRATSELPVHDALTMESIAYSALQAGREYRAWLALRRPSAAADEDGPRILVDSGDDAVTIRLNRPGSANAVDTAMRHELMEVLTAVAQGTDRIILRGCGDHFCAGGDLTEFTDPDDVTQTHRLRLQQGLAGTLARWGERVEARVHGAVIGAGLELSAFANRIVAEPNARFRLPEVRMGLLPGSGGTVSVPRRMGPNRALVLMLTGAVLDAERALRWGLIDEVEG